MKLAASITFEDQDSLSQALAIVRYDNDNVALCLSSIANGDIEVVMKKEDTKKLVEALNIALSNQ